MRFTDCYKILENGGFVTRKIWKDTFLWMKQKADVKSEYCKDQILKMIADANGGTVKAEQTICIYNANERKVITGWTPQQNDMAADDWKEVYIKVSNGNMEIKMHKDENKEQYAGDLFDGVDVFRKP